MWRKTIFNMANGITTPCNVACGSEIMTVIHQVAAPCSVIRGSGMSCHGIRANVRHIGILHLVSSLTISPQLTYCNTTSGFNFNTSPQSTCHYAPVCKILSKSDHPQQKKLTSCRFSRWRTSAILDFRGPVMGPLNEAHVR